MGDSALEWQTETRDGATVALPSGRIDETTATEFRDRLGDAVAQAESRVIVDLDGIAYMSSRGLRALTLAQRQGAEAGVTIVLSRPNPTMREILAISRYDTVFRVTDSIEDALAE